MSARIARLALASALGGALLAPSVPLAAEEPPPPPVATIEAAATPVTAGTAVRLDSSHSTGAITGHRWDLDGDGAFETDTGADPAVEAKPEHPGPLTVRVRVTDSVGQTADGSLDLTVTPAVEASAPPPRAEDIGATPEIEDSSTVAKDGAEEEQAPAAPAEEPAAEPTPATAPTPPKQIRPANTLRARATRAKLKTRTVRAAGAHSVAIKDFAFKPASISVSVGDSITWTNQDSAPHTATANDGSFDTGNLDKGQSGSVTLSKAGTFAYICSVHPSMKGTVVVAGASSGGGSTGGGSDDNTGSAAGTPGATTTTPGSTGGLPRTGLNLLPVVLLALLFTGSGTLLRRRLSPGR